MRGKGVTGKFGGKCRVSFHFEWWFWGERGGWGRFRWRMGLCSVMGEVEFWVEERMWDARMTGRVLCGGGGEGEGK